MSTTFVVRSILGCGALATRNGQGLTSHAARSIANILLYRCYNIECSVPPVSSSGFSTDQTILLETEDYNLYDLGSDLDDSEDPNDRGEAKAEEQICASTSISVSSAVSEMVRCRDS